MPSFMDIATIVVLGFGLGTVGGFFWWIASLFLKPRE